MELGPGGMWWIPGWRGLQVLPALGYRWWIPWRMGPFMMPALGGALRIPWRMGPFDEDEEDTEVAVAIGRTG
jgi:hypothetical protein